MMINIFVMLVLFSDDEGEETLDRVKNLLPCFHLSAQRFIAVMICTCQHVEMVSSVEHLKHNT